MLDQYLLVGKKPRRARPIHGLFKRNFVKTVRWAVDQDYVNKLTPEEQEWLSKFNDHYYGAKFTHDVDGEWSPGERRKTYVAKNAANRDIYAISESGGFLDVYESNPNSTQEASGQDFAETPEYLESPDYKRARAEFRSHLKPHLEAQPIQTSKYLAAKETLKQVTPQQPLPLKTYDQEEEPDPQPASEPDCQIIPRKRTKGARGI